MGTGGHHCLGMCPVVVDGQREKLSILLMSQQRNKDIYTHIYIYKMLWASLYTFGVFLSHGISAATTHSAVCMYFIATCLILYQSLYRCTYMYTSTCKIALLKYMFVSIERDNGGININHILIYTYMQAYS